MTVTFEFEEAYNDATWDYMVVGLNDFAKQQKGMPKVTTFTYTLKNDQGEVCGGAGGYVLYGCLYIDLLYIDAAHRGHGNGLKLMQEIEAFALTKDCHMLAVCTMDWEARPFYETLGFQHEFTRSGFNNNSAMHFLKKAL